MWDWNLHLSLYGTFLCAAAGLFVWYTCSSLRAWYRLRHIPSVSIFAHFSYLWLAKTTYSGNQYWVHRELNKTHGSLVRVGPNEIVTDDPEIIKKISSTHSTYKRSSYYLTGRFNPYHDNIFTILEPDAHKKAKAKSMAACSGREIAGLEDGVDAQIKILLQVIRERYAITTTGEHPPLLDLGSITCYFTMDVLTHLAFGHAVGFLKEEKDYFDFFRSLRELWPQMSTMADIPWIRAFLFSTPFLKLFGPKPTDKRGFGALMGVAELFVNKRFESDAKAQSSRDILASFINRGFSQEECQAEGLFLLLAGSESTACAIRSILAHAVTSPHVYSRLKEEIYTAVREKKVSHPISSEEAKSLPYLQAVIYEGIRMRPPLLGFFPKVVPAGGDSLYDKYIPAGTDVGMNISSLLRSVALFGADANIFRPERFTELDKARRSEMERNVELAFGYGQWMCAGKTLAFMELNKFIFEILREFEMQMASPLKPCDVQSYGVFIEKDLFMRISKAKQI